VYPLLFHSNIEVTMFGNGSWETPQKAQQEAKGKFHKGG
jgi:hypothetical protein